MATESAPSHAVSFGHERRQAHVRRVAAAAPLVAVVGLAAALRFSTLGRQSFWLDEAFTIEQLHHHFWHMLGTTLPRSEASPPLYFILAWPWARLTSFHEVGLRSLSAVFGTATVPVVYAVTRRWAGRPAALLAALVVAVNPFLLWYSQEARPYALLAFLAACSLWAAGAVVERASTRRVAVWALACVLLLATHYYSDFLVAAEGVWLLATVRPRGRIVIAAATFLAVGIGFLLLALRQSQTNSTAFITDVPLVQRIRETGSEFLLGRATGLAHAGAVTALLVAVIVLVVAVAKPPARRSALGAIALGAGVVVLALGAAVAGRDTFLYRYLIVAWIPLAVGISIALMGTRRASVGAAAAAVLLAAMIGADVQVSRHASVQRDDWRSALRDVPNNVPVIAFPDVEVSPLLVYRPQSHRLTTGAVTSRTVFFVGVSTTPLTVVPPKGFRLLQAVRVQHLTIAELRSSVPRTFSTADARRVIVYSGARRLTDAGALVR